MEDKCMCQECHRLFDKKDLYWTKDRYGIPFKHVCENCFDEVQENIWAWVFDEADAGEHLEPEEY